MFLYELCLVPSSSQDAYASQYLDGEAMTVAPAALGVVSLTHKKLLTMQNMLVGCRSTCSNPKCILNDLAPQL